MPTALPSRQANRQAGKVEPGYNRSRFRSVSFNKFRLHCPHCPPSGGNHRGKPDHLSRFRMSGIGGSAAYKL
jgi:hypothetical protein